MLSSHLWSTLMMWFSFLSASLVMFLLWIKFWVEMLKLINHILTTSFYIMISLLILRLWVIGYLIFYFIIFMISLKREFLRIVINLWPFFHTFVKCFDGIVLFSQYFDVWELPMWISLWWTWAFHCFWIFKSSIFLKYSWFSIMPFAFQGIHVIDGFRKQKQSLFSNF